MAETGKIPRPERTQTDESLRTEREQADSALVDKQLALEDDADEVIQRARETADAVLIEARARADQRLAETSKPAARAALAGERKLEDSALRGERAAADESLRFEREENARALSQLLPLERDKTDRHLLTERGRSDEALANRDDFLGMVSHDLRNLLSGIVVTAKVLSDRAGKAPGGEDTLLSTARIQRYAARMNRLIGDLVDVASIDAGKLVVTPLHQDVVPLVTEAVETFQAAASAKGITLHTAMGDAALTANFDHDRLLQVLANVITNAIKFTDAGGRIDISGRRAGGEVRISISDTGCGVAAKMLELIFQRFWQVGKNDGRGLGLGLYISRCIIEAHGGKIWAESQVGQGSTFQFTLPGAQAA